MHGAQNICFTNLIVKGTSKHVTVINICDSSTLSMHGCVIDGSETEKGANTVMMHEGGRGTECSSLTAVECS